MPKREPKSMKACCMVSEILEEAGIDRDKARQLRRQVLQGIIVLCEWQLERMEASERPRKRRAKAPKARRVPLD